MIGETGGGFRTLYCTDEKPISRKANKRLVFSGDPHCPMEPEPGNRGCRPFDCADPGVELQHDTMLYGGAIQFVVRTLLGLRRHGLDAKGKNDEQKDPGHREQEELGGERWELYVRN